MNRADCHRRLIFPLAILVAASTVACSKDTPTAPSAPVLPACQTNNTALLAFANRSVNSTYTVQFNNATVTTLGPGQETGTQAVAAGVQHTVTFIYANSTIRACTPLTPILAQCSSTTASCAF